MIFLMFFSSPSSVSVDGLTMIDTLLIAGGGLNPFAIVSASSTTGSLSNPV